MTTENLATHIGELISIEIDDINSVKYRKDAGCGLTSFIITMESGKQFAVEIKEIVNIRVNST